MKKRLLCAAAFIGAVTVTKLNAQCDFTPEIVPKRPILCPNGKDTLVTTETYDSYQWYRNNRPIPGATHRSYIAHSKDDVGAFIKVEATKNGCTAFSKRTFVDGWVFNPPIIIETGDVGVYDAYRDALIECKSDTLTLTLGSTYTVNIQWYNNYRPIPGADGQSYNVTQNGSYTVCGAPDICPDYVACEGIPLNALYDTLHAQIAERNDTLFASGAGDYQWFYNGEAISNSNKSFLVPLKNGRYRVAVRDRYTCRDLSEVYVYTVGKKENLISVSPNPVHGVMYVRIKSGDAAQIIVSDLLGNRLMQVPVTSFYQTISLSNLHTGNYTVQLLSQQKQVIGTAKIFKE
jgi:hypothetical protein